jgi:hypothetical protein
LLGKDVEGVSLTTYMPVLCLAVRHVLRTCAKEEVIRVAAAFPGDVAPRIEHITLVANVQAFGDRAMHQFIGHTMRTAGSALEGAFAVAMFVETPDEEPTGFGLEDMACKPYSGLLVIMAWEIGEGPAADPATVWVCLRGNRRPTTTPALAIAGGNG